MAEPSSGGWTRFFRRGEMAGEDFIGKFLAAIARIFEGGDEEETFRQIRSELVKVLDCSDVSLFAYDPAVRASPDEGDWVLEVKSGFGEGNRVCQADAKTLPELEPGKPAAYTDELAQKAALKAIALAFEEDAFYGCDIEKRKVVLLRDPKPEDDLGSGDLSVLAIPLRFHNRLGRVSERARVGVLALFKTPVRRELAELESSLRSLLAYAIITSRCTLKDPVTGLFTEGFLREELERQAGLFRLTDGKLRGGLVVGMIDTLKVYKQTLESAGKVDPNDVSQRVSDALRGVAGCVWRRCKDHSLDQSDRYQSGYPGRIGHEGFGAVLPLLQPNEMCMWAVQLARDVKKHRFEAEELLAKGDLTVSLRIIPFAKGPVEELWKLAKRALDTIEEEQLRARRDPAALSAAVDTIKIFAGGKWMTTGQFMSDIRLA